MPIACVDVPRVKGKMAERGYTITSMSNQLGINRNTLALYLEKPNKMPYKVISNMADALCDSADEAATIFLPRTYVKRNITGRRGGENMNTLDDMVKRYIHYYDAAEDADMKARARKILAALEGLSIRRARYMLEICKDMLNEITLDYA